MAYPVQTYYRNIGAGADPLWDDGLISSGIGSGSLFGMADQLVSQMLQVGPGLSSFSMMDTNNPNVKSFGVSSMNVTQMSRGPDGQTHLVQAHDERRMGPGGVWQTKKALRDSDRGIDKMQVGYFVGDRGEMVERQLDPTSGQYRHEVKRRGIAPNEPNFNQYWRAQAQQAMQQPLPIAQPQQYYQQAPQALPASYVQY